MKRFAVLAVIAAVVAVPAMVAATTGGDWRGGIKGDPMSFATFNVKKNDAGKKRVVEVFFGRLDITCAGGIEDETDGVELLGGFRVRDREFGRKADAVIAGLDPPANLTGKFKPGKRAVGTIRVRGELDPKEHPGVNCRTGILRWKTHYDPLE